MIRDRLNGGKTLKQKLGLNFFITPIGILIIGILTILLIGLVDYLVTVDLSLSIGYLIPILVVTKYLDRRSGILLSVLSTVSWYLAEYAAKSDLSNVLLTWNTLVRLTVFLIVVYLLSATKNAYEHEKELAQIDGLTKIYNRRYFLETLKLEVKRAIRHQRRLTLVYFDVDNFKTVNDRQGHAQGDKLLRLIASTVSKTIRETDVFARLGGDEFALILPETNYQTAQLVLQRIQRQLNDTVAQESFEVSFSIGAVTFSKLPDSVDLMLEQVDSLMYQVKHSGKNGLKHQPYEGLDF